MIPANRRDRSAIRRWFEAHGVRMIALDRTLGQSPFSTSTRYAACPVCGVFASVYRDIRGVWSLCGHLGDPRRPLDDFDARRKLLDLRGAG